MKILPNHVKAYKKTPVFTQDSVPKGLLKAHSTKSGTWAKICIIKGKLLYVIENGPEELIELSPSLPGIVEPEVLHHIKPLSDVEFFVEFYS